MEKSKEIAKESDYNLDTVKEIHIIKERAEIVKKLIGVSPYIIGMICLTFCVSFLSGKTTVASVNIIAEFAAKLSADRWVAYIFGGFGVTYGAFERKFRKRKVKDLGERIQKLEKNIDPNRSSSKLNKYGDTNEGDK